MSSIALSLYDNENARQDCYTCPDGGIRGNVRVRGKNMMLDCRMYTEIGNQVETMLSARETDIYQTNLIHIVPVGVDSVKMSWGTKWKFKTQSRGAGGLDKYDCAVDYQIPELIKHDKIGYTELLYVHHKGCPKKYISTELQDMVYQSGSYSDSYDYDNQLSDMLIMSARETVAESVQYTDITGIFGGANEKANAYDGILAQAYWAYTGMAYYHSIQFTIDEALLTDGTFLHAKYSGQTIDIEYDSSIGASDPDINKFKTRAEVYERIVDWLNKEVTTASDRRYVDATFIGNKIIVTSKWTEATVNLSMFIDSNSTVPSWASCDKFTGVSFQTLQGAMPIDERPVLVQWKRYTADTILRDLVNDIHSAKMEMDLTLLRSGQELALYFDKYLWEMYTNALKTRPRDATPYDIREDYTVYTLDALSEHGGTGIWFLTASSATEANRNIAHLVDTERRDTDDIYVGPVDAKCREFELLYDTLHGVMVKDFRLFASNLLNSPFSKLLKNPHEKTIKVLPCYNPKVRSSFIDRENDINNASISARFEIVDEYRNEALYYLDGSIVVREDGDALPNGALPVYEIQLEDRTAGIPVDLVATAVYEYKVTTDDGVETTLTAKDPIIQYAGNAAGTTLNIVQTVTLTNGSIDTFNASEHYEGDYPFEMRGGCADNEISLALRIDDEGSGNFDLTIVDQTEFDEGDGVDSVEVYVYDTGGSRNGSPEFETLNIENESIADHSTPGWTIDVVIVTKFGCTYDLTTDIAAAGNGTITN